MRDALPVPAVHLQHNIFLAQNFIVIFEEENLMRIRRTLYSLAATTALTGSLIIAAPGVSAITVTVDQDTCTTALTVPDYRHILLIQSAHLNELFRQLKLSVPSVSADLDTVYTNALEAFRSGGAAEGDMPIAADSERHGRIGAATDSAGFDSGEYAGIVMGTAFAQAYTEKNDDELRAQLLGEGTLPAETRTRAQAAATLAELEAGGGGNGWKPGFFEPGEGASPKLVELYGVTNSRVDNPDYRVALKRALQSCVNGTGGDFPLADLGGVPEPDLEKPRRSSSSSS